MVTSDRGEARPIKILPCVGGQMELFSDRVVVERTEWSSRLGKGPRVQTVYLRDIEAVSLDDGYTDTTGLLRLTITGNDSPVFVPFRRDDCAEVRAFKALLEERLGDRDTLRKTS